LEDSTVKKEVLYNNITLLDGVNKLVPSTTFGSNNSQINFNLEIQYLVSDPKIVLDSVTNQVLYFNDYFDGEYVFRIWYNQLFYTGYLFPAKIYVTCTEVVAQENAPNQFYYFRVTDE
jgi:hypothetical protein